MTLEETIVSICTPVFGAGKFFHIEADDDFDTASDYGVFSIVGGDDPANNAGGAGNYATARVQFTILGRRSLDIIAKAKALRTAMIAANDAGTLRNLPQGPGFDLPGDETLLRGRILEYQITSFDPLAS